MKTLNEIRPIKQTVEADLLKREGVTGVDIGYKYVKGKKTDELSIRVYVEKKKDVPEKKRIPKTIQGVKTDVIERKFILHPLLVRVADIELKADTGNYDPLQGGISIGPCRSVYLNATDAACHGAPGAGWYVFVGTLGAFVRDNTTNAEMMLSNFHVMCVDNGWSVGDTMAQPSRVDGGSCPSDVVGTLQRASLGGQVDCAVADHTMRGYNCSIVDIGTVAGTATAAEDMAVRKRGRTTGLTYGTVDTVDLSVNIDYCNGLGSVMLTNQIGIDVDPAQSAKFGDSGDSGSVVVDDARKVVGLYFAGDSTGTYGVANPIQSVLNALNVSMCLGAIKKFEPEPIKKFEPEPIKKFEPEPPKKFEPEPPKKFEPEPPKKFEPEPPIKGYEPPKGREPIKGYEPPKGREPIKGYEPPKGREPIKGYEPPKGREPGYFPPGQPLGATGSVEERLARIEAALAQSTHFIRPELRPEMQKAPLSYETDKSQR